MDIGSTVECSFTTLALCFSLLVHPWAQKIVASRTSVVTAGAVAETERGEDSKEKKIKA